VRAGARQRRAQLFRTTRRVITAGSVLVTDDTRAFARVPGLVPEDGFNCPLAPGKSLVQVTTLQLGILSDPPLCPPSSVRFRKAGAHREPCCTYGAYCTMRQVRPRAERSKNKSAAPAYGTPELHHPESSSRLANSDLYPARIIARTGLRPSGPAGVA